MKKDSAFKAFLNLLFEYFCFYFFPAGGVHYNYIPNPFFARKCKEHKS